MWNETRINRIKEDLQALNKEFHGVNDPTRLVDPGQSIRQIKGFVEELDEAFSQILKTVTVENNIIVGTVFQAERKEVTKKILDTERVKVYLGKKLPDYQKPRTEIHLKYKPRF